MSTVLDNFFGTGNEIKPVDIDPTMQALLDSWQAAIRSGGIGFLPRRSQEHTYWYAFAPSTRQRRELLGLLDAWVGPTYSDLALGRGELELSDPFDSNLAHLEVVPLRFEVLPRSTPHSGIAKNAVRNALVTLTRLANERPPSQFEAIRTTVEILDDLGHAVAASDRSLAEACMTELEQSADLDESNLAFLRLRLHAGMHDWAAMFADPALDHVLSMRRPLGVTRIIQSGLYFERFQVVDHEGAESEIRTAAKQLEPRLRDLYTGAPPRSREEAVVELVCRLLATSAADPAVEALIDVASGIQSGLDDHFRRIISAFLPESSKHESVQTTTNSPPDFNPTAQIASLLLQGEFAACIDLGVASEPSVESGRALVHAARQISSMEWAVTVINYLATHNLKEAVAATTPTLRADVQWLESLRVEWQPRGWEDWFAELEDPSGGRLQLSNEAIQSWESLPSATLVDLLTHATDTALTKLGTSGGQFLAAHSYLLNSPDAADVTARLVAAMALSDKASAGVRVQTLALIESFGMSGPSQGVFEEVLDWAGEILNTNAAATTVSWVCDIVQTLTSIPVPGSSHAVLSMYYTAIKAIRPYRSALDFTDLEALEVVAAELGIEVPADFRAVTLNGAGKDPAADFRYLEDKMVVLYSLTESAVTRASQILKRLVPLIDVRTNSEHDGSTQLGQLSANADIFVVVTAAAKHAATICIADHRRDRPTVLVNSRGSSAILRALADFKL